MDREHGSPVTRKRAGALSLSGCRVGAESHRFMHRFVHSFVARATFLDWPNPWNRLLLFCASGVERQTKHGAPARSNLPGLLLCGLESFGPRLLQLQSL